MSVKNVSPWKPDWVVLPGETIREKLAELGKTQLWLSGEIGISQSYVSDIVRGGRNITPRFALSLERVLGISAEIWLGLQMRYDLAVARAGVADLAAGQPISR